jgi:hypothetical protein
MAWYSANPLAEKPGIAPGCKVTEIDESGRV